MKRINYKYCVALPVVILLLLWVNDVLSYSRRIGNTRFYLVETMANSKEGKPLAGLYYKVTGDSGGYKGVEMSGYPKMILWNDKYIISKNYDGNNENIIGYVVINQNSVNTTNGYIEEIYHFTSETDYYAFLRQIKLSESKLNETGNHILW